MLNTQINPQAWIGCLACYNNGQLVGKWMDMDDLEVWLYESTADGLTQLGCRHPAEHEETWVMDHDGYGAALDGECSPAEAYRLGRALVDLAEEAGNDTLVWAYVTFLEESGDVDADALTQSRLSDAYQGDGDSEADWAQERALELDEVLMRDMPSVYRNAISWQSVADEWLADCTTVRGGGRVMVFQN